MANCVIFSLFIVSEGSCSKSITLLPTYYCFHSLSFCLSECIINVALNGTESQGHNRHEEEQIAWDSFWMEFILLSAIKKFTFHIYLVDAKLLQESQYESDYFALLYPIQKEHLICNKVSHFISKLMITWILFCDHNC
jgi:hypothetical protein